MLPCHFTVYTPSKYQGISKAVSTKTTMSTEAAKGASDSLQPSAMKQQQFHRKSIGDWDFIKTIGAGSMGKVKLAQHSQTKEFCAVKIIPRAAKLYERSHTNADFRQKDYDKEVTRDKRTIREGALGRLLYHPFICRMYEMIPMTNHYYMLFEHVDGGQMLDYIVAHGLLKERHARKHARGIALALDYCHKNNVVHRDLKIENIMINEQGDIKLIDFGLSNLYSSKTLLKTYCGSLYFAAPELLSAKPYIGPEVDIWSFGVVLYVLVCGKVPFDDQSVSVLHGKIKKGDFDYPPFLSRECVSLLSRMLVVDPLKRATLHEVLNHPWINKGFDYKVVNHFPKRTPLSLPLDPNVIKTMSSYDIGSAHSIHEDLTNILGSLEYQMSCQNWLKLKEQGRDYASASNAHILPDPTGGFHPLISIYFLVDEKKKRKRAKEEALKSQLANERYHQERNYYQQQQHQQQQQQKLPAAQQFQQFQQLQQQPQPVQYVPTPVPRPQRYQEHQQPQTVNSRPQQYKEQQPPQYQSRIVHPQNSASKIPIDSVPIDIPKVENSKPSHQSVPITPIIPQESTSIPIQTPVQQISKPVNLGPISFPERVHTSTIPSNFDKVIQSTHVQDVPHIVTTLPEQIQVNGKEVSPDVQTLDPGASKSGFNSILRKLSTKKPRQPQVQTSRQSSLSPTQTPMQFSSSTESGIPRISFSDIDQNLELPSSPNKVDPMVRRGVSMKVTAKERLHSPEKQDNKPTVKKLHNRSASSTVEKAKVQGYTPVEHLPPLPHVDQNNLLSAKPVNTRRLHPTARAKSVGGHTRKQSSDFRSHNDYPPLPSSMISQNSDGESPSGVFFDDIALDEFEYQEIPQLTEAQIIDQFNHAKPGTMPSIEHCKTLFLKGFFSVQTTSTKPLPVIRYNVINVLSKLGVRFREVKGGFACSHAPSLREKNENLPSDIIDDYYDEKVENDDDITSEERKLYGDAFKSTSSSIEQAGVRSPEEHRTPTRQPSLKIDVALSSPTSASRSTHRSTGSTGSTHRRKFSIGTSILGSYKKKNSSGNLLPPNTPSAAKVKKDLFDEYDFEEQGPRNPHHIDADSVDSLNGLNIGGGSDMLVSSRLEHKARHLHSSSISSNKPERSPLKFEIHIVKVPLVGLYGVQFKKLLGNTWNYKALASQILNELNL